MNYSAPAYGTVAAAGAAKTSTPKVIFIIVGFLVLGFFIASAVVIAIVVGLVVGLKDDSLPDLRNRSTTTSTATTSTANLSTVTSIVLPLSPPVVNCTYNSSTTCGCSAVKPVFLSSRIVNGNTAVANSWPWMVTILTRNGGALCAGVLISAQHVLTAAHCLNASWPASSVQVFGGVQTLSTRDSAQIRNVSNFTNHPGYVITPTIINDIAVMTLTSPFNMTSSGVGICCLPTETSVLSIGNVGVIIGWGLTSLNGTSPSDNLLQGVVQVRNESSCVSASSAPTIRFCAGYGGTDACFGDSGGPFMISSNNAWVCAGVVSNGNGCGQSSLYTRVSAYRQFIFTNTGV